MCRNGENAFTTAKISRIKAHLGDGGELGVGGDSSDVRAASATHQGELEHNRTHKDGGILSVKPMGERD